MRSWPESACSLMPSGKLPPTSRRTSPTKAELRLDDVPASNPILRLILFAALACAACSGCRARPGDRKALSGGCFNAIEKSQDGKYRGFLTSGREEAAFIPCDCEDIWWVEYNRVTVGQVNGAKQN